MQKKFAWVIEGDVKACFDEISHKSILKSLREKIMDNRFLDLVRRCLKAGVMVDGVVQPTDRGVPQGGVLSPLLANVVLNKLDWFLHGKGHHGAARKAAYERGGQDVRFVRYADDWCVFLTRSSRKRAEDLRGEIRRFLKDNFDLELSMEKTQVTHVGDGFDFLGVRMVKEIGKGGIPVPKVKVGDKAIKSIKLRLDEALRYRPSQESVAIRIMRANRLIRGWREYFRVAHNLATVANKLNHYSFWSAVKMACRKHDISTRQCVKRYCKGGGFRVDESCELMRFSGASLKYGIPKPPEYVPGRGFYLEDNELEAPALFKEGPRQGAGDMRRAALHRDKFRCRCCAAEVTAEKAQVDHIDPVKRFANFSLAHTLENLQTLCIECHARKTRRE